MAAASECAHTHRTPTIVVLHFALHPSFFKRKNEVHALRSCLALTWLQSYNVAAIREAVASPCGLPRIKCKQSITTRLLRAPGCLARHHRCWHDRRSELSRAGAGRLATDSRCRAST